MVLNVSSQAMMAFVFFYLENFSPVHFDKPDEVDNFQYAIFREFIKGEMV